LKQLYIPQRCNNVGTSDPCEAHMRSFTSKTVSDEMRLAFMAFAPALPRPSDMAQPKIVDIGAGLAMYHPYLLGPTSMRILATCRATTSQTKPWQSKMIGRALEKQIISI
jgi:hypothetical protein